MKWQPLDDGWCIKSGNIFERESGSWYNSSWPSSFHLPLESGLNLVLIRTTIFAPFSPFFKLTLSFWLRYQKLKKLVLVCRDNINSWKQFKIYRYHSQVIGKVETIRCWSLWTWSATHYFNIVPFVSTNFISFLFCFIKRARKIE